MANTLRRKMFKLGGEVNTHGVGITSGLEYRRPGYNAGGAVEQRVGYQSANHPSRQGNREGHGFNLLPLILPGARTIGQVVSRGSKGGLEALKRFFRPKTGRGPGGERVVPGEPIRTTTPRGTTIRSKTVRTPGERLAPGFRDYASLKMAPRYLGAGLGGLGSLGAVSSLLPQFDDSKDDTVLENILDTGRGITEGAFNIMGGPLTFLAQAPFRKGSDIQGASSLVNEALYGKKDTDSSIGSSLVDTSVVKDVAETQEEQFAKMKDDANQRAELYYDLMSDGGPDKTRALAAGLTNFGNLYDEDKVAAISGFSEGVGQELDRQSDIKSTAMQAAIGDVIAGDSQRKQMIEQAKLAIMSSPDLTATQRAASIQGLEAFEAGIVSILPTNDKGDEADDTRMAPGEIYFDPANLYGGMYVAKPTTEGAESKAFTTLEEAQAHAAS